MSKLLVVVDIIELMLFVFSLKPVVNILVTITASSLYYLTCKSFLGPTSLTKN